MFANQTSLRRSIIVLLLFTFGFMTMGAAPAQAFPDVIPLPNGFQPEGIASGNGTTFYVGSIPTGAVYRGDLQTSEGEVLVPAQAGRSSIGLKYDARTGLLFVAGGMTGYAYIYDGQTGANIAEIEAIPLGGDYQFTPGGFNANGIDATPDGKTLIIVNSADGALYNVDPTTGIAIRIDLGGGSVPNGDGILLQGNTLYVVQNVLNQIAVAELNPDLTSGTIVDTITSTSFRVPTTIAKFGDALYAVNARFDTPPTPNTEYEVVRVTR